MENAIKAHIFGRKKTGDREEARILLFNPDGTPFVPGGVEGPAGADGLPGAQGPAGPAGPAGSAGAPGASTLTVPYTGLWYPMWPYGGSQASQSFGGYIVLSRTVLPVSTVMGAVLARTGGTNSKVKLVAYADTPTGPGARIAESVDMDTSTAGAKSAAFVVPAGPCWIGLHGSSTGTALCDGPTGWNPYLPGRATIPTGGVFSNAWLSASGQGTTTKDPFPMTGVTKGGADMPGVWLQAG